MLTDPLQRLLVFCMALRIPLAHPGITAEEGDALLTSGDQILVRRRQLRLNGIIDLYNDQLIGPRDTLQVFLPY